MRKICIMAGNRFGSLYVLREVDLIILPSGQTNRAILCKCDCGNEKIIRLLHLVRGRIKSCGCIVNKHGWSGTKLYAAWNSMFTRCYSEKYIDAHRYLLRDITVCEQWKSFDSFKEWALSNGYMDGLQIDRKNNNKGYEPDNCRFVTSKINVNNREVTFYVIYNNERVSLSLLLDKKGIQKHYHAIFGRLKRGWGAQAAVDTPIRAGNYQNRWK